MNYMNLAMSIETQNQIILQSPLQAAVIDFDNATPRQVSKGSVLGTPGYMLNFGDLRDGSKRWDGWAHAETILEVDMEPGELTEYQAMRYEACSRLRPKLKSPKQVDLSVDCSIIKCQEARTTIQMAQTFVADELKNIQLRKYEVFRAEMRRKTT